MNMLSLSTYLGVYYDIYDLNSHIPLVRSGRFHFFIILLFKRSFHPVSKVFVVVGIEIRHPKPGRIRNDLMNYFR